MNNDIDSIEAKLRKLGPGPGARNLCYPLSIRLASPFKAGLYRLRLRSLRSQLRHHGDLNRAGGGRFLARGWTRVCFRAWGWTLVQVRSRAPGSWVRACVRSHGGRVGSVCSRGVCRWPLTV